MQRQVGEAIFVGQSGQYTAMTLPEHAICSAMIAQFGVRQRLGTTGVILVTIAGISPDLDSAAKLVGDDHFWRLHHALGHNLLSIGILSATIAAFGYFFFSVRPSQYLFLWCFVAALVHCLTDALYWWGIKPLWPFSSTEICFGIIEYLDLIVLSLWLSAVFSLYKFRDQGVRIASLTFVAFTSYVLLRALMPAPTGFFELVTGGWMFQAPQGTPVLDWW